MKNKISNNPYLKKTFKNKISDFFHNINVSVKDFFYGISVSVHSALNKNKKQKPISKSKRNLMKNLFIFCVLIIPVINFFIFYVGVNANSILLAFQKYDYKTGSFVFNGFKNFAKVWKDLFGQSSAYTMMYATKNSFIFYFFSLLILMPIQIMSSFFVYKKIPCSEMFKVFLYLPSLISSIVMVVTFKYFVDKAIPEMLKFFGVENVPNLFYEPKTSLIILLIFKVWFGFGGGIILYTGAMSRIPDSLIEFGKLEGMSMWQEFWKVTMPLIYPTVTVFLVTGIAGIFTEQAGLYAIYSSGAPQNLYTYGYYLFVQVIGENSSFTKYPYASALGLLFTVVVAPLTLLVKYLLEKYGPTAEF